MSIEKAVELALAEAERKDVKGLLVWDEIPELEDKEMRQWWGTPQGDKETIYSIASFISNSYEVESLTPNEVLGKVEDALIEKYPNKCH